MTTIEDVVKAAGLTYVGIRGTPGDGVACIGEAPGTEEVRHRLPFVGPSGRELGRMLREGGWNGQWRGDGSTKSFEPTGMWFTNVFPVQPPDNKIARLDEYKIPNDVYISSFFDQIRSFRPRIIIATGATSLGYLFPESRGRDGSARIGTYRGSILSSPQLDWPHYIIPCPHPAFILRQWDERPIAVLCLEKAREEWEYLCENGELQPLPVRKFWLQPDADFLIEYLTGILDKKTRVSVDIELLDKIPAVYGIAISPWEAISFSIWDYPTDKLVRIWRLLNEILRTCPQIGQNYIGFDCSYGEWLGFEPDIRTFASKTEDTMILHHILWPEMSHKLEFLQMQYTREPYHKDEGKKWKPKDGIRALLHYNAMDTVVTYEVYEAMKKELEERSCQLRTP